MVPANETRTTLEAAVADVIAILMDRETADIEGGGADASQSVTRRVLERYVKQIEFIGEAASKTGLPGLQDACALFQENVVQWQGEQKALDEDDWALLEEWPVIVMGYMDAPEDGAASEALLDHLKNPRWSAPLDDQFDDVLRSLLLTSDTDFQLMDAADEQESDASITPLDETAFVEGDNQDKLEQESDEPLLFAAPSDSPSEEQKHTHISEENLEFAISADADESAEQGEQALFFDEHLAKDQDHSLPDDFIDSDLVLNGDEAAEPANITSFEQVPESVVDEALSQEPVTDDLESKEHEELIGSAPISPETLSAEIFAHENKNENENEVAETLPPPSPLGGGDESKEVSLFAHQADEPAPVANNEAGQAQQVVDPASDTHKELELVPAVFSATTDAASRSAVEQEFVELLCAELAEIDASGEQLREQLSSPERLKRNGIIDAHCEELQRLGEVVASMGLDGMRLLFAHIEANFASLAESNALQQPQIELLKIWPRTFQDYLQAANSVANSAVLLDFLQQPQWPLPLSDERRIKLQALLNSPMLDAEMFAQENEERQTSASNEDISLTLPGDVNQELLDSLLQELPTQTAEFTEVIQRISDGNGDNNDVDIAQRLAHTVKGAANTVGVPGIANLTHHMEDILLVLAREHAMPSRALANSLMNAADCLESMSESLLDMSPPPEGALNVLQEILDWANRIDEQGLAAIQTQAQPSSAQRTVVKVDPPEAVQPGVSPAASPVVSPVAQAADLEQAVAKLAEQHAQIAQTERASTAQAKNVSPEQAPVAKEDVAKEDKAVPSTGASTPSTPMLRVPAPLIDELLRLVGESIILTAQVQERARVYMEQAKAVRERNNALQTLTTELERMVQLQGTALALNQPVTASDFDPLEFDQYSELHTLTHRIVEAVADARVEDEATDQNFTALETLLIDQARLHRESQDAVLRTRMVPVTTIVQRLHRSVRQTCRLTDKEAKLDITGADTLIDSNILNAIIDPLMHILRNAVDHGIEAPLIRRQSGKIDEGQIGLSFVREGNNIVVRCQDDGSGLDFEAIRKTAQQRGLLSADQGLNPDSLSRLILEPGFSTRTDATQVSGRGVGMDIVYSQILALKGAIIIHSEPGRGCTIELRLPVTLISTHALLIRSQNNLYAVSERGIEQIVYAEPSAIRTMGDVQMLQTEDSIYEIDILENLMAEQVNTNLADVGPRPVLIVREETGGLRAVMVEEITDSRDLVVKSIGPYVPEVKGVLGATIMGDGGVAPVLDLPELLRTPWRRNAIQNTGVSIDAAPSREVVLIADDSLSVRRSMQQLLEDAGFEVRGARDGLEAVSIINTMSIDALLVDLEMPRMNGLELTSFVRNREDFKNLPILMITSRTTSKHREEATRAGVNAYLTKPISDDELLSQLNQAMRQ